jgi:hypothetical protein
VEHLVRNANAFVKNQDLIFELLDEAKIDILKINNFNSSIANGASRSKIENALKLILERKNYKNAIAMDKDDDYEQKQISFSGMGEILDQNRIGLAADSKFPLTKLFGLSPAGFSNGESDIENYNSMVESEVRAQVSEILDILLPIICRKVFGFCPEDLTWEFKPLRILSAKEDEEIKTMKQSRIEQQRSAGLFSSQEYDEALRKEGLVSIDTAVRRGERELEPSFQPSLAGNDQIS